MDDDDLRAAFAHIQQLKFSQPEWVYTPEGMFRLVDGEYVLDPEETAAIDAWLAEPDE